jgi:hypothetical protein
VTRRGVGLPGVLLPPGLGTFGALAFGVDRFVGVFGMSTIILTDLTWKGTLVQTFGAIYVVGGVVTIRHFRAGSPSMYIGIMLCSRIDASSFGILTAKAPFERFRTSNLDAGM